MQEKALREKFQLVEEERRSAYAAAGISQQSLSSSTKAQATMELALTTANDVVAKLSATALTTEQRNTVALGTAARRIEQLETEKKVEHF